MANLFLSHGDYDSKLQNLSTQLAKFLLAGRFHASPMLQNPHGLCGAHQARKTQYKLSLEMMVNQSLGAATKILIL